MSLFRVCYSYITVTFQRWKLLRNRIVDGTNQVGTQIIPVTVFKNYKEKYNDNVKSNVRVQSKREEENCGK